MSLLLRTLVLSEQGLMISFNLNYLVRTLSPNRVMLGIRASTYRFWKGHNSVHSSVVLPKDLPISTEQGVPLACWELSWAATSVLPHFPQWESLATGPCDKTVIMQL